MERLFENMKIGYVTGTLEEVKGVEDPISGGVLKDVVLPERSKR